MFMRNRLARKMAAEMRGATCAGTQTSKAPTLSGPSVTIIILCLLLLLERFDAWELVEGKFCDEDTTGLTS